MNDIELIKHIGNVATDLSQSLEELGSLYGVMAWNGTTKIIDTDGNPVPIDTMIELVEGYSRKAREIEHFFKYV